MSEEINPIDQILTLQTLTATEQRATKTSGALVGAAVADAMGWITEFVRSRNNLERLHRVDLIEDFVAWKKKSGGRFNTYIDYINPGEYSDDTQLSLCTARAVRSQTDFEVEYFAKVELPQWLDYARGAGATLTAAAASLTKQSTRWNTNFFTFKRGDHTYDYRDAGANGVAMRIAPIALAMADNLQALWFAVLKNAITTHGHARAILGAHLCSSAIAYLLRTKEVELGRFIGNLEEQVATAEIPRKEIPEIAEWANIWNTSDGRDLDREFQIVKEEILSALKLLHAVRNHDVEFRAFLSKLGCFDPKTKGSGVSTVVAAIGYFLYYGRNFRKMVIQAVNEIGTDTDTIASMAATFAGTYYGIEVVPEHWANRMQDFQYLMRAAETLAEISMGSPHYPSLGFAGNGQETFPNIRQLVSTHSVAKGQRVWHPIFGPGWVRNVDVQRIKRRSGGEIMLATVGFDMGQSCKFKAYLPSTSTLPRSKIARSRTID